jgi:hypothetical protein
MDESGSLEVEPPERNRQYLILNLPITRECLRRYFRRAPAPAGRRVYRCRTAAWIVARNDARSWLRSGNADTAWLPFRWYPPWTSPRT